MSSDHASCWSARDGRDRNWATDAKTKVASVILLPWSRPQPRQTTRSGGAYGCLVCLHLERPRPSCPRPPWPQPPRPTPTVPSFRPRRSANGPGETTRSPWQTDRGPTKHVKSPIRSNKNNRGDAARSAWKRGTESQQKTHTEGGAALGFCVSGAGGAGTGGAGTGSGTRGSMNPGIKRR